MRIRARIKEWLFGRCPGFAGSFPHYGTRVYFPQGCSSFKLICREGAFEPENVHLLCRLARQGGTFLDVGANLGLMASPVLRRCPQTQVVSFEPSPATLRYLEKTIASSPYRSRWRLVPKALCECEGTVDFFAASEEKGVYDGMVDTGRAGSTRKMAVPSSSLDIEWARLKRPKVCVIKIDVEGAETKVLNGARECLGAQHPPILLEWNRVNLKAYGVDPSTLLTFAVGMHYSVHAIPGLVRISTVSELALHMKMTESFLLWPSSAATSCIVQD